MNPIRTLSVRPISITRSRLTTISPRRFAQTQTKPTPTPTSASASKQPPKPRRLRAGRIFYGLVFVGGLGAGFLVRDFASPTPWPAPGTVEDELYLKACAKELESLDIVKYMRSKCIPSPVDDSHESDTPTATPTADEQPSGTEPKVWVELDIKNNIVESPHDSHTETRTATFESMAGIRGLGVQRAFVNTETKELVAVVWIGKSLGGWPGLAHGGAIATIFQDCMARMVAGPKVSIDSTPTPTSLKMTYAKKTRNHSFYIIRAHFSPSKTAQVESLSEPEEAPSTWSWLPLWKKVAEKIHAAGAKETVEITGTMEDLNGDLLVAAKGTFPVV